MRKNVDVRIFLFSSIHLPGRNVDEYTVQLISFWLNTYVTPQSDL